MWNAHGEARGVVILKDVCMSLSRLLTIREQVILAALALSILLGAGVLFVLEWRTAQSPTLAPEVIEVSIPNEVTPLDNSLMTGTPDGAQTDLAVTTQTPPENPAPESAQAPQRHASEATKSDSGAPARIGVAVMGAVQDPGFYWMDASQRVIDLIEAAGGFTVEADTTQINQAARLIDGSTLTVPEMPRQEEGDGVLRLRRKQSREPVNPAAYVRSGRGVEGYQLAYPGSSAALGPEGQGVQSSRAMADPMSSASHSGGLVSLNHATQRELESLPGIGPVLAGRIIQHRNRQPFQNIHDLMHVNGIGPQRFEDIRNFVTVY